MTRFILNFHGIGVPGKDIPVEENRYWLGETEFENILDQVVTVGAQHEIEISFDDGNSSDVIVALRALAERGLSATFFVCTGRIGRSNYLDKGAINELLKSGMRIGSHGVKHVDWRKCSTKQLEEETRHSKEVLEDVTGGAVEDAGIPFGSYDRRVISAIKSAGYKHAYTSDGGFALESSFLMPRNTLEASPRSHDILHLIEDAKKIGKHLKRKASIFVKQVR